MKQDKDVGGADKLAEYQDILSSVNEVASSMTSNVSVHSEFVEEAK